MATDYESVIGLECHVQLKTESKLFSSAKNHYGDAPNQNVSVIDAGLPGVLPVVNDKAVRLAIRLGLALKCDVQKTSVFARKHYFYPDLPKGYQTTQFETPICLGGRVVIDTEKGVKEIALTRIHIEEDAGKSTHGHEGSLLDYNRAGTPLLEVVTEPCIENADEAMAFFKELRAIVSAIDVCDGNLQEGSMRADANVSIRPRGEKSLGQRTETKNLNSIRFLGQAIRSEISRQKHALSTGEEIVQQTRLWDSEKKQSRVMREKEDAHDYRYFPCPDLLPLVLSSDDMQKERDALPELPRDKRSRYENDLGLTLDTALFLTQDIHLARYFEKCLEHHDNATGIANLIQGHLMRFLKERSKGQEVSFEEIPIDAKDIAELVALTDDKTFSQRIAKDVFSELEKGEKGPQKIADMKGWKVVSDEGALEKIVDALLVDNPKQLEQYRAGKTKMLTFFVGQVMKATKGSADPAAVNALLKEKLNA